VHSGSDTKDGAACFVHALLEQQPVPKISSLDNIAEAFRQTDAPGHVSETHSRLLTKKQLIDMAWGVRELSKRLGSIRLKLKVQTVFLLTKPHDEEVVEQTRNLTEWLLSKERNQQYIV
jgi:NAD+ kinase